MIAIKQDSMWTKPRKKGGYLIPGGWHLVYGLWSVDPDRETLWMQTLLPECNFDAHKARKEAKTRAADMGASYEKIAAIDFLRRMAETYAKRFPDLIQENRTLRGFDPEKVTKAFLPYRKSGGRDGDLQLRQLLLSMATNARQEKAA